jgi:hypothetical protein
VNLTTIASLPSEGVSVFTYPLEIRLLSPERTAAGAIDLTLTGPPGVYAVFSSSNLAGWTGLGTLTNNLGSAVFTDAPALSPQKFYRAQYAP